MGKLHFPITVGIGAWPPCGQHKEIKNKEEKMARWPQNGVEKKIKKKTIPEMVWKRRKVGQMATENKEKLGLMAS